MRIRRGSRRPPPWPIVQTRVPTRDHAHVETFIRAWRTLHPGGRSAALRALLALGLTAAARPQNYDERWLDVVERLSRIETLLDALGVAVCAMPALVAFLQTQADPRLDEAARGALADNLELLLQAEWDQRCRTRGIPRPRFTKLPRTAPVGAPVREPTKRPWKTTVRLKRETRERVVAVALRDAITSQAALRHALELGLRQLEAVAHHDPLQRLFDATKRIEIQLDEIGALATGGPAVAVHLWRRAKRLGDEDEALLLAELHDVAVATWAQILAGPPRPPLPDVYEDAAPVDGTGSGSRGSGGGSPGGSPPLGGLGPDFRALNGDVERTVALLHEHAKLARTRAGASQRDGPFVRLLFTLPDDLATRVMATETRLPQGSELVLRDAIEATFRSVGRHLQGVYALHFHATARSAHPHVHVDLSPLDVHGRSVFLTARQRGLFRTTWEIEVVRALERAERRVAGPQPVRVAPDERPRRGRERLADTHDEAPFRARRASRSRPRPSALPTLASILLGSSRMPLLDLFTRALVARSRSRQALPLPSLSARYGLGLRIPLPDPQRGPLRLFLGPRSR